MWMGSRERVQGMRVQGSGFSLSAPSRSQAGAWEPGEEVAGRIVSEPKWSTIQAVRRSRTPAVFGSSLAINPRLRCARGGPQYLTPSAWKDWGFLPWRVVLCLRRGIDLFD